MVNELLTPADIKAIRLGLKMSQGDFAKAMGVVQSVIGSWECGGTHPRYERMILLNKMKRLLAKAN